MTPPTQVGRFSGGYYSEHSAVSITGLGPLKIRALAAAGEIRTVRENGLVFYSKEDVRKVRDARPRTTEEQLLDAAFRGYPERAAERESMARENGHVVSREHQPRNPGETATSRMHCTCGWFTEWLNNSIATQRKREHLKDAAI